MSDKEHDFGSLVCIYAQILPRIREAGKQMGYAIAIHGTMKRDLDLLAVPWVEEAAEPIVLVKMVADVVGGYVIGDGVNDRGYISDHPTEQPHGRMSWNICWGGKVFIDLSVMPLTPKAAESEAARLRGALEMLEPFFESMAGKPRGGFVHKEFAIAFLVEIRKALTTE